MDLLFARGERDSKDMLEVLEQQQARIKEMLASAETPQLTLGFNDDERRQLEADQRHWRKRVAELARDVATEPERIRRTYHVKAKRIDVIGVVYLWPVTG